MATLPDRYVCREKMVTTNNQAQSKVQEQISQWGQTQPGTQLQTLNGNATSLVYG